MCINVSPDLFFSQLFGTFGCFKLHLFEKIGENVEPVDLEEAAIRSSLIQQIVVIGQVEFEQLTLIYFPLFFDLPELQSFLVFDFLGDIC